MKNLFMFAAAFMLFATTACEDVDYLLADDADGTVQGDDTDTDTDTDGDGDTDADGDGNTDTDTDGNTDTDGDGTVGQIKKITFLYYVDEEVEEGDKDVISFSYDESGRVSAFSLESTWAYDDGSYSVAARSQSTTTQTERRSLLRHNLSAMASGATTRAIVTGSANVEYTCDYSTDGVVVFNYEYDESDDEYDETGSCAANLNSDGTVSDYEYDSSYYIVQMDQDPDTGEYVEVSREKITNTYELKYSYSDGYVDTILESAIYGDADYNRESTWSFGWSGDGNLVGLDVQDVYFDDAGNKVNIDWGSDSQCGYTYGSNLNNVSIDIAKFLFMLEAGPFSDEDMMVGIDRMLMGGSSTNLPETVWWRYFDADDQVSGADASRYEYEYTDSLLTKITLFYTGWLEDDDLASATYEIDMVMDIEYYE